MFIINTRPGEFVVWCLTQPTFLRYYVPTVYIRFRGLGDRMSDRARDELDDACPVCKKTHPFLRLQNLWLGVQGQGIKVEGSAPRG